jgi:protease-4
MFLRTLILFSILIVAPTSLTKPHTNLGQVASGDTSWAQWQNPAGMAFIRQVEFSSAYNYEWFSVGNRHQAAANLAVNFIEAFTLGLGFSSHQAFSKTAKENLGTDFSGLISGAVRIGRSSAAGVSFSKQYNFLRRKSSGWAFAGGFQSRINRYFALGGLYEKLDGDFFSAPNLHAGFAVRPWAEHVTFEIDTDWLPKGFAWSDGYDFSPVFSLATDFGGIIAQVGMKVPDIKTGWSRPTFSADVTFNFENAGFGLLASMNSPQKTYTLGGQVRLSQASWKPIKAERGRWVSLDIDSDGALDTKRSTLVETLLSKSPGSLSILALMKRLVEDERVAGVILNFNAFDFGHARAEEWRNVILAMKAHGKEVVVHLENPSILEYYVASAADIVYLNPHATISFSALSTTLIYLADTLDKLGIKVAAVTSGRYKTAPRMWTHSRPQKEELEVAHNILSSFHEAAVADISQSRNIAPDNMKHILDQGEITATNALALGLVDQLVPKEEVAEVIAQNRDGTLNVYADYQNLAFKNPHWQPAPKIVVIPIMGGIVPGRVYPTIMPFQDVMTGDQDVVDAIDEVLRDPDVSGMIVRIDSPGGEASASHTISRAIAQAERQVPVVISMGDVAASGGYLAAVGAKHIYASKNTLTGSIGVFSMYVSAQELARKIGAHTHELSLVKNPGGTLYRPNTQEELATAQKMVDWQYENFLATVAQSLALPESLVKENAAGRVWLGKEAFDRKLITQNGGFLDSIDKVYELAKLDKSKPIILQVHDVGDLETFSLGTLLTKAFAKTRGSKPLTGLIAPYADALHAYEITGTVQARLPFDVRYGR